MEDPEAPVKLESQENQNGDHTESPLAKPQKKKLTKKVTKRKKEQKEQQNSSEEDEDEESEDKGKILKPPEKKKRKKKSKKTFERRNIKALLTEDRLEESTKNALVSCLKKEDFRSLKSLFTFLVLTPFNLTRFFSCVKKHSNFSHII